MKFTLAFLAVAFSAADAATLRTTKVGDGYSARQLDTKVSLRGVQGEPSATDMDIIGLALIASYNDVYWQVGHYMTGGHDTESLGRTDGSAEEFEFSVQTPVSRNGNAGSILGTALTDSCAGMCNKDASAELEVAFCNKIRSSESEYLKSTNHCSIQFEQSNKGSKHHAPAATTIAATIDTTLLLKGVAGDDATQEDLAVIAKAYVSAYNDVHWNAGHYMSDVEIPFSAGTPLDWSCLRCGNDVRVAGANTLVLDVVAPVIEYTCRRCRRDDDASSTIVGLDNDELARKAVEVAFCKKLRASVSDKLRVTEHCAIVMETVLISDNGNTSA